VAISIHIHDFYHIGLPEYTTIYFALAKEAQKFRRFLNYKIKKHKNILKMRRKNEIS
jgi:hypothetical protein